MVIFSRPIGHFLWRFSQRMLFGRTSRGQHNVRNRAECPLTIVRFIPTGWIHAVYTNEDAIVIGGNFLHTFNVATQLRVYQIEQATEVPIKFRFPYYTHINWYALEAFDLWLKEKRTLSYFELESMAVLALFFSNSLDEVPGGIEDPLGLTKRVLENSKLALLSSDIELPKIEKQKSYKKKAKKQIQDEELSEQEEVVGDDEEWDPSEEYVDEEPNIPVRSKLPIKKKRQDDSSDEEDDSMGTCSKKTTKSLFLKRKKSNPCSVQRSTTVKQRLLERMSNKRV